MQFFPQYMTLDEEETKRHREQQDREMQWKALTGSEQPIFKAVTWSK